MDDKIAAISSALTDAFQEVDLEYQFTDDFHKFRANLPGMTHWLYVSPETMDDNNLDSLVELLETYRVIEDMKEAKGSSKFLLIRDAFNKVDSNFPK